MTDPIADMLTRIRNAVTAKHTRVDMPASRLKAEIARILQDEGYIQGFKLLDDAGRRRRPAPVKTLRLFLKYGPHGEKVITGRRSASAVPAAASTSARDDVPDVLGGPRHQHPDDVARRDDRPRGGEGRRRRRSALQHLVAARGLGSGGAAT